MNLLKKYHLWWLIAVAISGFMFAVWVVFALTGLNLLTPLTHEQGMMQIVVFTSCFLAAVFGSFDERHKK